MSYANWLQFYDIPANSKFRKNSRQKEQLYVCMYVILYSFNVVCDLDMEFY